MKTLYYLPLLCLLLMGCQREETPMENEPEAVRTGAISIQLAGENTRSAVSAEVEDFSCAFLFAFRTDNGEICLEADGSPIALYTESRSFSWSLPIGLAIDILAIVNPEETLKETLHSYVESGTELTESDLTGLNFCCTSAEELLRMETDGTNMPMSCRLQNLYLQSEGQPLTLTLKRLFSRYDIKIDTRSFADAGWRVRAAQVGAVQSNTEAPYFYTGEGEGFRQTDAGKLSKVDFASAPDLSTLNTLDAEFKSREYISLYFLENCQGDIPGASRWSSVRAELGDAVSKCSYLGVSIRASRDGYQSRQFQYRVYLGSGENAFVSNFDVKRNYHHSITLTMEEPQDGIEWTSDPSRIVSRGDSFTMNYETSLLRSALPGENELFFTVYKDGVETDQLTLASETFHASDPATQTCFPNTGSVTYTVSSSAPGGTYTIMAHDRDKTVRATTLASVDSEVKVIWYAGNDKTRRYCFTPVTFILYSDDEDIHQALVDNVNNEDVFGYITQNRFVTPYLRSGFSNAGFYVADANIGGVMKPAVHLKLYVTVPEDNHLGFHVNLDELGLGALHEYEYDITPKLPRLGCYCQEILDLSGKTTYIFRAYPADDEGSALEIEDYLDFSDMAIEELLEVSFDNAGTDIEILWDDHEESYMFWRVTPKGFSGLEGFTSTPYSFTGRDIPVHGTLWSTVSEDFHYPLNDGAIRIGNPFAGYHNQVVEVSNDLGAFYNPQGLLNQPHTAYAYVAEDDPEKRYMNVDFLKDGIAAATIKPHYLSVLEGTAAAKPVSATAYDEGAPGDPPGRDYFTLSDWSLAYYTLKLCVLEGPVFKNSAGWVYKDSKYPAWEDDATLTPGTKYLTAAYGKFSLCGKLYNKFSHEQVMVPYKTFKVCQDVNIYAGMLVHGKSEWNVTYNLEVQDMKCYVASPLDRLQGYTGNANDYVKVTASLGDKPHPLWDEIRAWYSYAHSAVSLDSSSSVETITTKASYSSPGTNTEEYVVRYHCGERGVYLGQYAVECRNHRSFVYYNDPQFDWDTASLDALYGDRYRIVDNGQERYVEIRETGGTDYYRRIHFYWDRYFGANQRLADVNGASATPVSGSAAIANPLSAVTTRWYDYRFLYPCIGFKILYNMYKGSYYDAAMDDYDYLQDWRSHSAFRTWEYNTLRGLSNSYTE